MERHETSQIHQQSTSTFGIARLYEYLAYVKNYPTPVQVAAMVSGMNELDVKRVIQGSPYFTIRTEGMIDRMDNYQEPVHDFSSGLIKTPQGIGRYVSFDPDTGEVTVEMDNQYLVKFDSMKCYLINQKEVV